MQPKTVIKHAVKDTYKLVKIKITIINIPIETIIHNPVRTIINK